MSVFTFFPLVFFILYYIIYFLGDKLTKYRPWEVCVRTKVLMSESVVCVYRDSAYLNDCSSGLLSRNVFLSPFPPAWKYCLIVSRAASRTAHCLGDRFTGAAFSMSFEMSWSQTTYRTRKRTTARRKHTVYNYVTVTVLMFVMKASVSEIPWCLTVAFAFMCIVFLFYLIVIFTTVNA